MQAKVRYGCYAARRQACQSACVLANGQATDHCRIVELIVEASPEQAILIARGISYLITDRKLRVVTVGGRPEPALFDAEQALGASLPLVLTELDGSEEVLYQILFGQLPRFVLDQINRDVGHNLTHYYTFISLPHYDANGRIDGIIQVVEDITDQGHIEQFLTQQRNELWLLQEQIRQSHRELQSANAELDRIVRLKDEFLATMSHELRTPLNAILGLSELLYEQISGPLNEHQQRSLQDIQESGRHLLDLLKDVIDMARIEAGKLELSMEPVDLRSLCRICVGVVESAARQKHVQLDLTIGDEVQLIQGDVRRLRQVLTNLLTNAVKFTPSGGTVGLDVQGDGQEQRLTISVWDTGIGIKAEDIPQIFQPFVQVGTQMQRHAHGSGLGLAIVARLVDLHGGSISVSSTPGAGSRFTVALPWYQVNIEELELPFERSQSDAPLALARAAGDDGEAPAAEQPLLLVAEDDPISRRIVQEYMQHHGYRVREVRSAGELLVCLREVVPAVVLMDVQLPGMDGLELLKRLHESVSLRDVPVIVVTALAMPGDRERCLAAGARAYLSKPVRMQQMLTLIQRLLASA